MNQFHDGRYPDYDIRVRNEQHPDDNEKHLMEPQDDNDEVEVTFDGNDSSSDSDDSVTILEPDENDLVEQGRNADNTNEDIITIDDDEPLPEVIDVENDKGSLLLDNNDEEYIEEFFPDKLKIIQVTSGQVASTSCFSKKLEETEKEKKILLKEKPNKVVKRRPFNVANKCKIVTKEQIKELKLKKQIELQELKLKKQLELQCQKRGTNIINVYEEITCEPSTSNTRTTEQQQEEEEDEESANTPRREEEEEEEETAKDARQKKGQKNKTQKGKKSKQPETNDNNSNNDNNNNNVDFMSLARQPQPINVDAMAQSTILTLEFIRRTQGIFDNCAQIVDKTKRQKRFVWFKIPLLGPVITSLIKAAVEEAIWASELHCSKNYVVFGKKCIPKDICPTGYIFIGF